MNLPDLKIYRDEFEKKGAVYPLKAVATDKQGLLALLPAAPEGKTGWPWTEQTDPIIYNSRKNWPKLTIVTPSYNQAAYLEETIRSILLQNYPNLEFIIMDGGSNDGSKAILEKYSPWISYWQSEKDEGQGQAINRGFSLASGDYYAWMNSDDYYLKDVFHLVMETSLKAKPKFIYGMHSILFLIPTSLNSSNYYHLPTISLKYRPLFNHHASGVLKYINPFGRNWIVLLILSFGCDW